jgi:hypothetical protein
MEDIDRLCKEVMVLWVVVLHRICGHSQGVLGQWMDFGLISLSDKVSFVN